MNIFTAVIDNAKMIKSLNFLPFLCYDIIKIYLNEDKIHRRSDYH